MLIVHKYPLEIAREQTVKMPQGAQILSVQMQNGRPYVWALVNGDAEEFVEWTFYVLGTGHEVPDGLVMSHYRGTVQDGPLVWHVFAHP